MVEYETIAQATLLNLVQADAVLDTNVVGQRGGWGVVVRYGKVERALAIKQGQVRIFRKLDTVDSFLRGIGLKQYQVDARQFDSVTTRTNDAARERMQRAHKAAAYDQWFSEEVSQAIKEADDPATQWVSQEEATASWAKKRAELLKRVGSAA